MKKMILLLSAAVMLCSLNSAKAQHDPSETAKPKKALWQEMKDFHTIMAMTFHPSETGDLKPLKENASQLSTSAKAWAASAIPEGFNKELTPKILGNLVTQCEDIESSVKAGANDEVLTKKIAGAHDVFHEIAEKCMPGKDHHHGHGDSHDHKH